MKNIAVLLTCYNRKNETIKCLQFLYNSLKFTSWEIKATIYLTDDGVDGTGELVEKLFPDVKVLQGTGSLFWNGGMRNSWYAAQTEKFDGYLLLNDDTYADLTLFNEILLTHEFSLKMFNRAGICIGSTYDNITKKFTYGGAIFTNNFFAKYKFLIPNGQIERCDLGNGNIMFVPEDVFKQIGMLNGGFIHGVADYDYTLLAKKNNIPVLTTSNYCGSCCNDHGDKNQKLISMSLKKRIRFLESPTGLAFSDNLNFMKRNFPHRLPFVFVFGWFKVLLPNLYYSFNKIR